MMNDSTRVKRRPRRAWPPTARTAAAIAAAATMIAACGSSSPGSGGQTNASQAQAQQEVLNFARCMRSHGISNFPDDLNFQNVPGINPSSPAFKTAQTACQHLLPVKRPPSGPPSAGAYTRLLHWAKCMRAHGIPSLPDPKPDPPPSQSGLYGTLMGGGGYWVGIPISTNAHSPAFIHLATVCGQSPSGHKG
jgi:hypothetical protein